MPMSPDPRPAQRLRKFVRLYRLRGGDAHFRHDLEHAFGHRFAVARHDVGVR